MRRSTVWIALVVGAAAAELPAHPGQASTFLESAKPYSRYEFLIGEWQGTVGDTKLREQFRWGPKKSYISFATYMAADGKPEQLHFEGMMVWNAKTDRLDYVVAVEPGSGVQEKGTVRAEPDGQIVREVELTDARGKTGQFRQIFRSDGPGKMTTSVLRQTSTGWQPTFPGSDNLALVRRSD